MKSVFLILRLLTGAALFTALLLVSAIVLLRSFGTFAKESAGVLIYVTELFSSGFTKGTAPKDPAGWVISWPQAALAALLISMIVSLFLPDSKTFLHSVAASASLAVLAGAWWMRTGLKLEILCLPMLALWFIYYVFCLFWKPSGGIG
jgi:hypothetical protein